MPFRFARPAFVILFVALAAGAPSRAADVDDNARSFAAVGLRGSIAQPSLGLANTTTQPEPADVTVASATANQLGDHPPGLLKAPAPEPSWPRTLVEVRKANEPAKPMSWSDADVKAARQACHTLLQGLHAVVLPVEPFRDGACGAPAAVQLVSLGRSPEVAFSPPPIVTCDMVAATANWLASVQDSARRHLRAPLVRIEVMSSYSCRNAYGRSGARLSEHGRANALDIGAFMTAAGYETAVLEHWGPTARRLATDRSPETAPPAQTASTSTPPPTPAPAPSSLSASRSIPMAAPPPAFVGGRPVALPAPRQAPPPANPSPSGGAERDLIAKGLDAMTGDAFKNASGVTYTQPSRLGGPTSRQWSIVVDRDAAPTAKSRFLKDIHESACRIFGTVLGPEANRAHENHFHIDMAERRTGSFCE